MPDKILLVVPRQAQHSEIGRWLWALADVRDRTLAVVRDCGQRTLDWTGSDGCENSIGTLLYHIAVVEASWVYLDVLRKNFPEEVKELLPLPTADGNRRLSHLSGVSLSEHISRLHATRKLTSVVFGEMDIEEWRRPRPPVDGLDYEVTPEWAVFHLMEHESGHVAQMSSLKARACRYFSSLNSSDGNP